MPCSQFPELAFERKNGQRSGVAAAAPAYRNLEVIMVSTVALRKEDVFENQEPTATRGEVLARYRQLREISKRHHSGALEFLSKDAIMHHARRLGLADGKTLILDSMDVLTLAFDLAVHTAPVGRSRAIDRYARSARLAPGSDEALVLEAMRNARFAVVLVQGRHQAAGLTVTDVFRKIDLWLVDEGSRDVASGRDYVCDPVLYARTFFHDSGRGHAGRRRCA